MSWYESRFTFFGLVVLTIAGLVAVSHQHDWAAPLDTSAERAARVQVGMTDAEVYEVLGPARSLSTGHPAKKFMYGVNLRNPTYYLWWENEFAVITVRFSGRNGDTRATEAVRTPKTPAEVIESLMPRGVCLILVLLAFGLFGWAARVARWERRCGTAPDPLKAALLADR